MNTNILNNLRDKFKLNLLKELREKLLNIKNNKNNFSLECIEYLKKFNNPLDMYAEIDKLNKKIISIKTKPIYSENILHTLNNLTDRLNVLKDNYSFFSTDFNGTYIFLEFYGEKLLLIKKEIDNIEEEINYQNSKIIPFPQKRLQQLKIKKISNNIKPN